MILIVPDEVIQTGRRVFANSRAHLSRFVSEDTDGSLGGLEYY